MTLALDMSDAGLAVVIVAFVLLLRAIVKAAKQRAENYRQLPEGYPGLTVDVYSALLWGGMLIMQISNILLHGEPGGIYRVVPLMWFGTAAAVFICGLFAGRLSMRLEMRAYTAKREAQASESQV